MTFRLRDENSLFVLEINLNECKLEIWFVKTELEELKEVLNI